MRSGLVVVGIAALPLASCASIPTPEDANDAVLLLRKYDAWAWAVGIALIWADLVLPVPQTVVIAALGIIYGTVLGGLLGSVGLITGGLFGYVLMLTSARRMVKRFVGPQSLNRMESLFERGGASAIVLTRSLPYSIPEAVVFLAGLAGMPMGKFTAAVTIGSVPTAFAFAAIGAGWADQPILALVVSYVLPILLLPIALFLMRRPSVQISPLARRRFRAEADIGRTIGVLFQTGRLRRAADPGGILEKGVRRAIVNGHRPVLRDRRVCRHAQTIGSLAVQRLGGSG